MYSLVSKASDSELIMWTLLYIFLYFFSSYRFYLFHEQIAYRKWHRFRIILDKNIDSVIELLSMLFSLY